MPSFAQTTIAFQGGEAGDCWGYTGGTLNNTTVRTGSNSLRVGRSGENTTLTYNTVNLSGYSSVNLSLYHRVNCGSGPGMDTREGALIEVQLNGSGTWVDIGKISGFGDHCYQWNSSQGGVAGGNVNWVLPNPLTYSVPAGTTSLSLRVQSLNKGSSGTLTTSNVALYSRSDEGFYVDDVTLTGTATFLPPTIAITTPTNPACQGQSVTFTATTQNTSSLPFAVDYQWYVNGVVVPGQNQSTYTTSSLANGALVTAVLRHCNTPIDTSAAITMVILPPPTAYAFTGPTTICEGNSATFILANSDLGQLYTLYAGGAATTLSRLGDGDSLGFVVAGLAAGNYSYSVVAGQLGCQAIMADTVTFVVTPAPSFSLGNDTLLCAGQQLLLAPVGNTVGTYLWSTGSTAPAILVTAADTVTLSITNAAGCTSIDTIIVNFAPVVNVDLGLNTTLCQGDSVTLDAGAGFGQYLWNTGATTQTLTVGPGTFWARVSLGNCFDTDTIVVSQQLLPAFTLGADTTLCQGQTLTLSAPTGFTSFIWTTNSGASSTPTLSLTANDTVIFTGTIGNCQKADTLLVTFTPTPQVDLGPAQTLCGSQTLTLVNLLAQPGDSYLWSNGSTNDTLTVTSDGTYSLTITRGNCTASGSVQINPGALPSVFLGNDAALCQGVNLTLDAGAGFASYLWSDGTSNQTLTTNGPGIYFVTVTNAGGCSATDSIEITPLAAPALFSLGGDQIVCPNQPVTLAAGAGYSSYLWNTGETSQTITVTNPGSYWVNATSACGAEADTVVISNFPSVSLSLGADRPLCIGESITLDAGPIKPRLWSTGDTTRVLTVQTGGTYSVTVTDACGLAVTDSVSIFARFSLNNVFPTVFTPNGDGLNEVFRPMNYEDPYTLKIANRWGQEIFIGRDMTAAENGGWDGSFNGSTVANGVYYYFATLIDCDGSSRKLTGSVTVLR